MPKSLLLIIILFCCLKVVSAQNKSENTNKIAKTDSLSIAKMLNKLDSIQKNLVALTSINKDLEAKILAEEKSIDSLLSRKSKADSASAAIFKTRIKEQSITLNITKEKLTGDGQLFRAVLKEMQKGTDEIIKLKGNVELQNIALKDSLDEQNLSDSAKAAQKTEVQVLKTQMAAIAQAKDSLDIIAEFEIYDFLPVYNRKYFPKDVRLRMIKDPDLRKKGYKWDKDSLILQFRNVKIEKVHILTKEGVMREIVVTTSMGIFRNKTSVIDLVHFEDRTADKLFLVKQKYIRDRDSMYIFLDDAVKYTPNGSFNKLPYADFNITLYPDKEHKKYLLRESTSINSYINVSAFTDIKGISGEPNAIAQFNADGKFISNTYNFSNSAIIPFNFISFMGGLSKYDSKFKGSMLINKDSIDRRDLFQRSNYSVGVKLNLLHGLPSPFPLHLIRDWQVNLGYNFIGSKVGDTTFKDKAKSVIDTTYRAITQNQWYIEPEFTMSRNENFSMTISLPFHMINVKESAKIKNDGWEYWAAPSINLMYYGKRDKSSKLFFRYNHFINLKDKTQAFNQLQLGYSLNLTSVWSEK